MKHELRADVRASASVSARARIAYSAESYKRFAEESGFRQDVLEKVIRLGEVASAVASDALLGAALALKGGTALNLMGDPIRRLSVDLDYNYTASIEAEGMLEDKPKVLEAFRAIGKRHGYSTDVTGDAHANSTFSLPYRNSMNGQDRIEVDINWVTRVPLGPLQRRQLWQPTGVERPSVQMVSNEELVAGKLRALLDRVAPRDVFDAGFLPEIIDGKWPTRRAKALFILFAGALNHPLTDYKLERVDKLSEADYQSKLRPVLRPQDVPDRLSLIERAKDVLRPMLELDGEQTEFTQRLQVGDYRPELLLPFDLDLAQELKLHPALLWKVQNARAHYDKKRRIK